MRDKSELLKDVREGIENKADHGKSAGVLLGELLRETIERGNVEALRIAIERSAKERMFWEAVATAACGLINQPNPPNELTDWLLSVLKANISGERAGPPKGKPNKGGRNIAMSRMVLHLHRLSGLTITRNRSKGTANDGESSCCDVVGAAMNLSYSTVENIWLDSGIKELSGI